jgi:hypothetical protein
VPDQQAEAEAEVLAEALQVNLRDLVTKEDLHTALNELEIRLRGRIDSLEAKMDGKFLLLQWMLGLLMGGVAAIILKAFL